MTQHRDPTCQREQARAATARRVFSPRSARLIHGCGIFSPAVATPATSYAPR